MRELYGLFRKFFTVRRSVLFRALFLLACVAAMYLPLAQFPFVQDDWSVLHTLTFRSPGESLAAAFSPSGKVLYRPLGFFYFEVIYLFFGLNPLPFHILALILLSCSAFLVVLIARSLTADPLVGWGSGFVFAAAASVHLDPLMWMVGFFDLGATLLGLASLALFLRQRYATSALVLACGLLVKESCTTIPFVALLLCAVMRAGLPERKDNNRHCWAGIAFPVIILIGYATVKALGILPTALRADNVYAVQVGGRRLSDTIFLYGRWAAEAVLPIKNFPIPTLLFRIFVLFALTGCAIAAVLILRRVTKASPAVRGRFLLLLFLAAWTIIASLPSLALANRACKYYLDSALAPLAIAAVLLLREGMRFSRLAPKAATFAIVIFVLANIADGVTLIQRKISLGFDEGIHALSTDGENHLIRKASVVRAVWHPLVSRAQGASRGFDLVLDGVNTECFLNDLGPQVWFHDSTITVREAGYVEVGSGDLIYARLQDGVLDSVVVEPSSHPPAPPDKGTRIGKGAHQAVDQ